VSRCVQCHEPVEEIRGNVHSFAGYGYRAVWHARCCPIFFDGSRCPWHPEVEQVLAEHGVERHEMAEARELEVTVKLRLDMVALLVLMAERADDAPDVLELARKALEDGLVERANLQAEARDRMDR